MLRCSFGIKLIIDVTGASLLINCAKENIHLFDGKVSGFRQKVTVNCSEDIDCPEDLVT